MRLREESNLVVTDLFELIAPPCERTVGRTDDIRVDLLEDNVIRIPTDNGPKEVPATFEGLLELGNWLDVPNKFQERLDPDVQQTLLNLLLARNSDDAMIIFNDSGVHDVVPTNARIIDPRNVIDIAARVVGGEASVVDWRRDSTGYGFDLVVPIDAPQVGGDRHVGDLTRGGLRFGQDTKHNLAPFVQQYLYRLVCTNGMEVPTISNISARGVDAEGVLESLEEEARTCFDRLDISIRQFYQLRDQQVTNPEQTLVRLAGEHGVSDRILANLLRDMPEYVDDEGHATMFDLINLVTNYANVDSLSGRFNARRALEQMGGRLTNDHSSRCPTCRSKLDAS